MTEATIQPGAFPERRTRALEIAVIIVLALAVSAPSLRVGFVWDDGTVLLRSRSVQEFDLGILFSRRYFGESGEQSYRPLVTLSYMIDHVLWGHEPTWSQLASQLIGGGNIRVPTGTILRIDLDIGSWREIDNAHGQLRWIMPPKLVGRLAGGK